MYILHINLHTLIHIKQNKILYITSISIKRNIYIVHKFVTI